MAQLSWFYRWGNALFCALTITGTGFAQAGVMHPIPGDPVVIETGRISGTRLDSGIHAYFGVPYAAPPVNQLRWSAPEPVEPWTGIYNADTQRPECIQGMPRTSAFNFPGEAEPISEDCLYLNIWAPPAAKTEGNLPVIVYIHGGGYRSGSANQLEISGGEISKKGVIYVSIAYRLGIFGYLAHPELTSESGRNASGNWAVLDQLAALQWVQRNIAAFGGDPSNVTLVGHSAGGMSVFILQSSPLSKGLFARVSGWSGSNIPPGGNPPIQLSEAEGQGMNLQQTLEVNSLAEMRALSWDRVNVGVSRLADQGQAVRTSPIVDGYSLLDLPENIFREHKQIDVPLLTASAAHDVRTLQRFAAVRNLADFRQAGREQFGEAADEFFKLFPASNDAEALKQAHIAGSNNGMGVANRDWARAHAMTSDQPSYLVQFNRSRAYRSDLQWIGTPPAPRGAFHGADIGYWLGTYNYGGNLSGPLVADQWDRELSEIMMDSLVAFARTGNPSTPAVTFPQYDPGNEQRVVFGDTVEIEQMNTEQIEFLRAHSR